MKRFVSILLTLTFLLCLATPASAAAAKAAVMRLQLAEGSVSVVDAAGLPVSYQKSMRLYSGYTVSTGSDSSAYILLDDEKAVKLDRDTTVVIKKSGKKLQVKLKAGQLIFNVTAPLESSEKLEIRTSSMVVGIRGSSGIVTLREVIFVTGHGVVYSGGRRYELSGGQGFQPKKGVFTAGVHFLSSLYLKEVRDDSQLQASIRAEGVYNTGDLIAAIPSAELREEDERLAAQEAMIAPPDDDPVDPAFNKDTGVIEPGSFTITWISDGKKIGANTVTEGDMPAWSGAAPTKEDDAEYTYTFSGWTPELAPATEDAAYTAVFTKTKRTYTITWKDDSDNIIDVTFVAYGETPTHAAATKAATDTASYDFIGWDPKPAAVVGKATYTAIFSATYDFTAIIPQPTANMPYDLFFDTEGNTPITTAKEGDIFTFYLGVTDNDADYLVRINGVGLGDDNLYYSKEKGAIVCTFIVPKDPVIEIIPN